MISFELPMPGPELSPNARKHWAPRAAAVAAYRANAAAEATAARHNWVWVNKRPWQPLKEPVHATVTFVLKTKRARDMDNLFASMKAGWDGLRDSGIIRDDTVWALEFTLRVEHEPRNKSHKPPRVKISLEGAP